MNSYLHTNVQSVTRDGPFQQVTSLVLVGRAPRHVGLERRPQHERAGRLVKGADVQQRLAHVRVHDDGVGRLVGRLRPGERAAIVASRVLAPLLRPLASRPIEARTVARALLALARQASPGVRIVPSTLSV